MSSPGLPLRVLIADDQPVAAAGAAQILGQRGIEVIAVVDDVRHLGEAFKQHRPNVIMVETAMGADGGAWAALGSLLRSHRDAAVVMFTCQLSAASVNAALDAGCLGVVPKTCQPDDLAVAVRDVVSGERHLHPRAMAVLLADLHANEPRQGVRELSRRELAVLSRVADGLGNIEIAAALGIGEATVKTHVTGALRKLDARDRAHAVSTAMRLGLLR